MSEHGSDPGYASKPALAAAAVAVFSLLLTLLAWPALSRVPFYTKGEPREALVVQSLRRGENFILPPRNGTELPSKPILFHWLGAAASILDAGVTERAVRIPSFVASLAALGATAAVAWTWSGAGAAIAASVVLATSFQWLASSVTARVDMLLAACVSGALLAFARAYHHRAPVPAYAYALLTAATLTKGPVGLLLPVAIVVVFLALRRDIAYLRLRDLRCLLVAAGAAACWYLAALAVGGEAFVAKQILKENVYRVLDPDSVEAGHVRPFWYYAPLLAAGAAPWSLFVPGLAAAWWRRRDELTGGPYLFALVWLAVTVLLFSLAGSKRSVYLLPAYPALALLAGRAWTRLDDAADDASPHARRARRAAFAAGAVLIAAASSLLAAAVLAHFAGLPLQALLARVLSETDAANVPAVLAAMHEHRLVVVGWAAFALATAGTMAVLLRNGRARCVLACAAALVLATSAMTSTTLLPALAERRSSRTFLAHAAAVLPHDAPLSFFGGIDYGAVFYRGAPIPVLERLKDLPDADGAWLLTWRERLPDLNMQVQERAETAATHAVEEVFADRSLQSSLLLVRIVRRPTDERSGGN